MTDHSSSLRSVYQTGAFQKETRSRDDLNAELMDFSFPLYSKKDHKVQSKKKNRRKSVRLRNYTDSNFKANDLNTEICQSFSDVTITTFFLECQVSADTVQLVLNPRKLDVNEIFL